MRIFLFNPENDLALASGLRHYTPPRQAQALHRAGAMLPFWLGNEEDRILVPTDLLPQARRWWQSMGDCSIPGPYPVDSFESSALTAANTALTPWGWSLDAVEQFRKAGIAEEILLPYEQKVNSIRRLSHRQNQLRVLHSMQAKGISIDYPLPICATTAEEVEQYVRNHGSAMLKSPWSSSGRGVFQVTAETLRASIRHINGIIRSQGSIMVEPLLPKLLDFALLFNLTPDEAHFVGISVFQNSTSTNYGGNTVASQHELTSLLSHYLPVLRLESLIEISAATLREIYGTPYDESKVSAYEGPIGIDMLIYQSNTSAHQNNAKTGRPLLAPCIEINLRNTMGFIAHALYQKTAIPGHLTITSNPNFQINFTPTLTTHPSGTSPTLPTPTQLNIT